MSKKVLLLNGSPHEKGCVFTALSEVGKTLNEAGVETEFFWIGNQPVRGCIGCNKCQETGQCAFKDELMTSLVEKLDEVDGLVVGSPVYYGGPNGSLCALLDRVCFSAGRKLRGKPAAAIVNCRRGGASLAFQRLNMYFTNGEMPLVTSQYWNSTHGFTPDEVRRDLEGLQTMRTLGRNMAWMLQGLDREAMQPREPQAWTHFIM